MDGRQHLTVGEIWKCLGSGPGYTASMISAEERKKYALALAEQMALLRQSRASAPDNEQEPGSHGHRLVGWLGGKLGGTPTRAPSEG
jgi:hypothetical protein